MARPLRIEYEGAVYHVTARGNERTKIYLSQSDYDKFLQYLADAKKKYNIVIHCYVLMGNHYHLIVETPDANLSKAMQYINGSYTTYLNIRRRRSGHLFQGRYKAIVVDTDNYLLELSRYIHLNPVRAVIVGKPEDYKHSSYKTYIAKSDSALITDHLVLGLMKHHKSNAKDEYRAFVEDAIGIELDNPVINIYGGMILGRAGFIRETLKTIKEEYYRREEVSHRKKLRAVCEIKDVLEAVSNYFSVMQKNAGKISFLEPRDIAIYLMKESTGATNREIGEAFGRLSYSAVSKVYQKMKIDMKRNRKMKRIVTEIHSSLYNFKG
ncbi:MAG: transposase [Nitrospiraceae bacterium]|nr:MAG: transposase [Nitrospiraceae bacterium]